MNLSYIFIRFIIKWIAINKVLFFPPKISKVSMIERGEWLIKLQYNQILWKIKLIITIYNQENFLKYTYFYIQKQKLKNIEIIFVDNAPNDMSSKIMHSLMKNDKRIIYIKIKWIKMHFIQEI